MSSDLLDKSYEPNDVEKRWYDFWEKEQLFAASEESSQKSSEGSIQQIRQQVRLSVSESKASSQGEGCRGCQYSEDTGSGSSCSSWLV